MTVSARRLTPESGMRSLHWCRAYAVDVPEIDADHRTLFQLTDDLRQAIGTGAAWTEVQSVVRDIAMHAAGHFSHEERLMRAHHYPHYDWHKRQHAGARARVIALARLTESGDHDSAAVLLAYLAGWLKDHIRLSDRMLGVYLRNRLRANAALAS
jgi:hemerythrin